MDDGSWRGIIPAYAGNTGCAVGVPEGMRDHPRVCGEHLQLVVLVRPLEGSSPRMRGTLVAEALELGLRGIIPAYAGNTNSVSHTLGTSGDHPRVCGEHAGGESSYDII